MPDSRGGTDPFDVCGPVCGCSVTLRHVSIELWTIVRHICGQPLATEARHRACSDLLSPGAALAHPAAPP